MTCSSSLADDLTPLLLDSSVLINLWACSFGAKILTVIPNRVAVPDLVVQELEHQTSRINGEHQFLQDLLARQVVQSVSLDDAGWQIFERLTKLTSLGDGEAATIAIAATNAYRPVIDDSKGRKSASVYVTGHVAAWSLDLLVHPDVQKGVVVGGYVEAIYLALREGRMRVDEDRCEAVVDLIGYDRALQCPSLPGFKRRRERWKRYADRCSPA